MKQWINKVWFERVILPYLMRNRAKCTVSLRDAVVYQCWYGGMSFNNINKWLRATGQETIKAYAMEGGKPRIFYEQPLPERRKQLTGRLVQVAQ